ncbi:DUF1365 domain-containing protein [Alcaligenes faecalis]|uniref:DUF1365 domain-containing protein n=1 Tax=Alcaligenes faecalis TaxID=511 RepID=UPI000F0BDB6F|nr:DUF1365 domain-containing protein [Alcaligenes faecalis]AYR20515.1 DUF1365 domain-containing protein [Alcaligenes faecalis]
MSTVPLIGFGHIWHHRLRPVDHAFRYPGYFLLLPMRSLREHPVAVLRRNRRGWISFHDSDHGHGSNDALAWFEALLQEEGIQDADGEIWLHTFPRVLGYVFKPVSFWYAHRADGSLAAILAEVNNTFGERHAYLLAGPDLDWDCEQVASKQFHVSPFCETQGEYRFRFKRSDRANLALIDLYDDAGPVLRTGVQGVLHPLSATTVRRAFFGTPLMTLGVIFRIHWQALRLWAKRLPFHRKPSAPKRSVTR